VQWNIFKVRLKSDSLMDIFEAYDVVAGSVGFVP
jgi:hypothetical protein